MGEGELTFVAEKGLVKVVKTEVINIKVINLGDQSGCSTKSGDHQSQRDLSRTSNQGQDISL